MTQGRAEGWSISARDEVFPAGMLLFFLCFWSYLARGSVGLGEIAVLTALVASIVSWGRVLAHGVDPAGVMRNAGFPFVALLGVAWTGLVLFLARWAVGWDLRLLFLLHSVVGAGLWLLLVRSKQSTPPGRDRSGRLAHIVALLATTAWVQHSLPPVVPEGDHLVFKPIRDFFIHTEQVILLAYPGPMSETGRYGLAGEPVPFYHYASYVFPAIARSFTSVSAFDWTLSLWLPMGFVLLGWSAYALGATWFGERGGYAALVAVLVIPDPSYWTFGLTAPGVYAYSFHRFLQIAMSNGYGIGVAGLGLILLTAAWRRPHLGLWGTGLVAAGSSLFFKAQIFMAAMPLALLVSGAGLVKSGWVSWHRLRSWGLIVLCLGAVSLVVGPLFLPSTHLWERTPTLRLEWPPGQRYSDFIIERTLEDPTALALARRAADMKGIGAFSVRVLLALFMPFRWGVVLLVGLAFLLWSRKSFRRIDLLVAGAVGIYLLYALFLAPNITGHAFGNPWDLQFVPFSWLYFVVSVWLVGRCLEVSWPKQGNASYSPVLGFVLLLWTAYVGRHDTDDWQTMQRWAYLRVPRGLVEAAQFIRDESSPGERFQDSQNDPYYLVEALAERRAYAGWPVVGSYTSRDEGDIIFQKRIEELAQLRQAGSVAEIARFAQSSGVRWYLLHPETPIAWPKEFLARPAFQSEEHRVYDLSQGQPF